MIWPSRKLKVLRHFLTATRKKTFWRVFSYPIGCKKKALSIILASSSFLKNSKHVENLQGFTHDSGFSETLHSQCMSSCIIIVVLLNDSLNYISCLDRLSRSLSSRITGRCFQSYMNIACKGTQNAACIESIWCFRSKMETKMILGPLPTSVHSNTQLLALQV